MAPARAFWKGYLKLSLVSCPIALYAGTASTERVWFRQINKKTGHRLRQQLVDEVTREVVEGEAKGRGYEYAKNAHIPVDDDELDALAVESKHTIEIDSFVPREQIDERYLDNPYYITPDGQVGQDAFAVIREAMRGKGIVALGRVVLAKRERVIALEPHEKGLIGTTHCGTRQDPGLITHRKTLPIRAALSYHTQTFSYKSQYAHCSEMPKRWLTDAP